MDELKRENEYLQRMLKQFRDECDEKDIDIDELKSYQDLEDTIENIDITIIDITISDFTKQLQKILDQLYFI